MTERILVVEDEVAISDAVEYALQSEGFVVDKVADGDEAVRSALSQPYDLIVLDLILPGVSGVEVCRRVRAESAVPILMLTARDAEVDRVLGLEVGADDYVTKPFSVAELVARVRSILRRRRLDAGEEAAVLSVGDVHIDLGRHEVAVNGDPVRLTASELKILTLLARQPDRVVSRRRIMQHLWDSDYVGDERACDLHVSNIRRKIERDPSEPERLVTVRGRGYKLQAV